MEDWDAISQSITHLNQSRAFAESDAVAAIGVLLEAIEATKERVQNTEHTSIARTLESLTVYCDTAEIVSRKRDERVYTAMNQLKQSVARVLDPEQTHEDIGVVEIKQEQRHLVDRSLMWHFLHEGHLEAAKAFSIESGLLCLPEVDLARAKAGFDAAEAMAIRRDLSSAICWVEEYSAQTSPNLLFDLHKLRFLQLAASQSEAIGYAQRHLARFNASRAQEIHSLLGSLILHGQAAQHGFASAQDAYAWDVAREALIAEIKRPYGSISVLLSSGLLALPELRTYQRLVAQDARITPEMWAEQAELPIHIPSIAHFHSEFCCPVSREQADSTNPPMLLACGHVIAKNSIARIAKHRQRFKCPTCPTEQNVDAPSVVHF